MSNFKTRGSDWRRWDLHVHTKGTNKNDNFKSSSFGEFCPTLFRSVLDNNIAAIGITDYCSIENYLKVKDYQLDIYSNDEFSEEEKDNIKELFLLPNVELRMLPVTGADRLINIHCLFNPEYVSKLDTDFFTELKFSTGDQSNFRMDRAGLVALGKSLDKNISEEEAYRKGVSNFVLEYSQLEKLINTNKKFRENTIIAVANSNKDGVSGLQKHYDLFEGDSGDLASKRQAIYRLSQCIFSGNPNDRLYFSGKKSDDVKTVISKSGSLKACIHGSDAHEEKKMFVPDEKRHCWIKADLSFEGLKQILYEPEQRVKIQEFQPDSKDDKLLIDEVRFISDDLHYFTPSAIKFNKNLNVIIGGKSSGKSILLYLIAKALLKKEDGFLLYKNEKTANSPKYAFENDLKLNLHILEKTDKMTPKKRSKMTLEKRSKMTPLSRLKMTPLKTEEADPSKIASKVCLSGLKRDDF